MSATLVDALVTQLGNLPRPAAVFRTQTEVDAPPPRYVVLSCDSGLRVSEAISGVSARKNHNIRVMAVAYLTNAVTSAEAVCALLADDVGATLTDFTPQVDGYRYSGLVNVNVREPVVDESIADRHTVYAIAEFTTYGNRTS